MNYRHAFHAGNFADLLKHAVLLELLAATVQGPPLTVIDTHAGAGIFDLRGEMARKTGESDRGIARLMAGAAPPPALERLAAVVKAINGKGEVRLYPGSPLLSARALRPRDKLIACEQRPDDAAALMQALPREAGAEVVCADGWRVAAERATAGKLLVLIDPPFEAADDYAQIARLAPAILRRNRGAVIAIWLPIKDLATYDTFLGDLADAAPRTPAVVAEARLRPLTDPMKMNGCAMVVLNPPDGLEQGAGDAAAWIAEHLGDKGALGRAWMLT